MPMPTPADSAAATAMASFFMRGKLPLNSGYLILVNTQKWLVKFAVPLWMSVGVGDIGFVFGEVGGGFVVLQRHSSGVKGLLDEGGERGHLGQKGRGAKRLAVVE